MKARAIAEANYLLARLLLLRACERSIEKPESVDRLHQLQDRRAALAAAEVAVLVARHWKGAK